MTHTHPVAPEPSMLDDAEVQMLYALHRTHLCLGVPLTVTEDRSANVIRVAGLVDDERIKEQVIGLLSEIPSVRVVRIEVKTLAEAADGGEPVRSAAVGETLQSAIEPASVPAIMTLIDQSSLPGAEDRS